MITKIKLIRISFVGMTMKKDKLLKLLLMALSSALIAIHINLTWRSENTDLMGSSMLFWFAVVYLISEKRKHLVLVSEFSASLIGTLAIALVLFKSSSLVGNDIFLRLSPLISAIGIILLFCSWKGLKRYWQELSLLSIFAIPAGLVSLLIDISPLTAKFAAFTLWSLGFTVSNQGVFITLPTGGIEVYSGCSGMALILQMLGLAMISLMLFPVNLRQKVLTISLAVAIAFLVNSWRVALLAVLTALGDQEAFKYWHLGDGSLIFSTMAVLGFGLLYVLNSLDHSSNFFNFSKQKIGSHFKKIL
jgi:cyanoexosortase A